MAESASASPGGEAPSLEGVAVGVVGLGLMGKPMALNLNRAGARVTVANRSRGPVDELAGQGLRPADSPRAAAEGADVVVVMVADTPAVDAVLHGPEGVVAGLAPGAIVIDMGTTAVPETRRFAAEVAAAGGRWLDAPVSGGQVGAIEGTLTIMAGGDPAVFETALPVLRAMGRRVTRVGDIGAGQVAKAANQLIVGLTIAAVSEAFTLAEAAGVEPGKVREALEGGFAWSRVMELHGQRMVDSAFTPGGRARIQLKDLVQADDLGRSLGVELPSLAAGRALYEALVAEGDGDLDHSALIRHYRRQRGAL
ncbi:MAG: NAD(P)-binding domain-containing protein [Azospirillaceae bacterium]